MRIAESRLLTRAASHHGFPQGGIPEVAFAGRSNVGKSSLINALVGRRSLARTSSTPGCTRQIHFFLLNRSLLLADLPGYGFARVAAAVREAWRPLVESYLSGRAALRLALVLVDGRRQPTDQDVQLLDWLRERRIPFRVAMTKCDELPGSAIPASRSGCASVLQLSPGEGEPVPTSARTGMGLRELWKAIEERLPRVERRRALRVPEEAPGRRDRPEDAGGRTQSARRGRP